MGTYGTPHVRPTETLTARKHRLKTTRVRQELLALRDYTCVFMRDFEDGAGVLGRALVNDTLRRRKLCTQKSSSREPVSPCKSSPACETPFAESAPAACYGIPVPAYGTATTPASSLTPTLQSEQPSPRWGRSTGSFRTR